MEEEIIESVEELELDDGAYDEEVDNHLSFDEDYK